MQDYQDGFLEIPLKDGFMLNTHFYQALPIQDLEGKEEVLKGRTQEIERLIARSLRAAVNLEALGPISLNIDCDVLNADGGTRCASITAANIALRLAVRRLIAQGICLPSDLRPTEEQRKSGWSAPKLSDKEKINHENDVIPHDLAALSVGLIDGEVYLDLDYVLDSNADVDMNVVKTSDGKYVEIQGTGEESTFRKRNFQHYFHKQMLVWKPYLRHKWRF